MSPGSSWSVPADTGIRQARAKTDRLDARTLAQAAGGRRARRACGRRMSGRACCAGGLARREQLVRARSRAKNEIHAVLVRRLVGRPPVSDLFGVKGRAWLRGLELPVEEAETVAALHAPRRVPRRRDRRGRAADRLARRLSPAEVRRLMTVPGVNVICAATFLAAVGDIRRFPTSRKLVGYLGLDPRVYQSGSAPAKGGRISKQGSPVGALGAGRSGLVGRSPARPAARVLRAHPRPPRPRDRRRRRRAQARRAVLVACSPAARTTPTSSPR